LSPVPPRPEALRIAGPAGAIEALLEDPQGTPRTGFGVICHPHPLHGGTMQNKVVHTLARALQEQGLPTLRFNYRGVGRSEGVYDEGRGEGADALAVIHWGRVRWPDAPLVLAGFSFGAMVALRIAAAAQPERLITVAPPVTREQLQDLAPPPCPWLIVQGEADELVDYREVQAWAARFDPPPLLRLLPGVDHFFHGRLHELRAAVIDRHGS
jgi:alpha/beta superfamily hydrolase